MTIKEELKDNIAILKITGELMSFPEVSPFHDHIKKLVADGTNQIIVDFSSIKWFGSAMLGTLTASLVTAIEAGGDLRLEFLDSEEEGAVDGDDEGRQAT